MHPEWHFKPHITIGYRDLTPENFENAWREYEKKTYHAEFEVTTIFLLKHNRKQWHIISTLSLPE